MARTGKCGVAQEPRVIFSRANQFKEVITKDQDLALVMGAEGTCMRRLPREQCDTLFAIPMAGKISSLNVSVSAGVRLFEAVRQRSIG